MTTYISSTTLTDVNRAASPPAAILVLAPGRLVRDGLAHELTILVRVNCSTKPAT